LAYWPLFFYFCSSKIWREWRATIRTWKGLFFCKYF